MLFIQRLMLVFSIALIAGSAQAMEHRGHDATKNLVRLSLWYEGPQSFNDSLFRPGAAEELAKKASEGTEKTKNLPEELTVALKNLEV